MCYPVPNSHNPTSNLLIIIIIIMIIIIIIILFIVKYPHECSIDFTTKITHVDSLHIITLITIHIRPLFHTNPFTLVYTLEETF